MNKASHSFDYYLECFVCGKKMGVFTIVGNSIFGSMYSICIDCLPEWIRRAKMCGDNFINTENLERIQEFIKKEEN